MAAIDDVIDGFYEACASHDRLLETVSAAQGFFRSPAGGLFVHTLHQSEGRMANADTAIALGYDPARLDAYWEHYYALNPMFHLARQLGTERVFTETDTNQLSAGRAYHESEFFIDWAGPQDLHYAMGEFVDQREDGVLVMSVWRPKSEGAFDLADRTVFARLNRHIARALSLGARIRMAESEMRATMGRMSAPVFTIGRDGRVRQCNAMADTLLNTAMALRCSNKKLRTAFPEDQAALDRLIACALDTRFAAWAENAAVPIRRSDGGPPLVARAIAVAQRFGPFAPDRPASAILTVEGFEAADEALGERLRRRLGLTPAQARVALQFRAGRSPAEAAKILGVSVETVRTHLKVLFELTGTHRQSELVIHLRSETGV